MSRCSPGASGPKSHVREYLGHRRIVAVALCFLASFTSPAAMTTAFEEPTRRVPNLVEEPFNQETTQLIVKFADDIDADARSAELAKHGMTAIRPLDLIGALVVSAASEAASTAAEALAQSPFVVYAEPDYRVAPFPEVDAEPGFDLQWGLHNTGQTINSVPGVPDIDIDLPEAHLMTTGSSGLVVAVIDDGVDFSHPDLAARAWRNPGESDAGREANAVDDDGNGLVDDVHGWDYVNDDATVHDVDHDGHGTHVAGTLAASLDAQGVAGVAPGVQLMGLKFIGPSGGLVSDAIDAIDYAVSNGADIINASWGGPDYSSALKAAIEASGVLFVAAAGNDGADNDVLPTYPASFTSSNIIAVASVHNQGDLSAFSNYGLTSVDLLAPGEAIVSTLPATSTEPAGWGWGSGTSMATPHVAGVAALAGSTIPSLLQHPAAMKAKLMSTVQPLALSFDATVTNGIVNAWAAANPFSDILGSPFRYDISWAFGQRISFGCSSTMFCPDNPVTREQMASFLVRALGLTQGGEIDYFTDDDGSIHETDINRLRHAEVTFGCSATSYCPGASVTREQMASFLVRAFGLTQGGDINYFTDDDGSIHETDINRLRHAEITAGCTGALYCPDNVVTREQMTAFLRRAMA